MIGVRKAKCLNLFRDLGGLAANEFQTINEIVLPFVPTETVSITFRANLLSVGHTEVLSDGPASGRRLFAQKEVGFVTSHAMQNDGEFARDGDPGARHPATLSDLQAPGAQAR